VTLRIRATPRSVIEPRGTPYLTCGRRPRELGFRCKVSSDTPNVSDICSVLAYTENDLEPLVRKPMPWKVSVLKDHPRGGLRSLDGMEELPD